jgi:hypothetical protein
MNLTFSLQCTIYIAVKALKVRFHCSKMEGNISHIDIFKHQINSEQTVFRTQASRSCYRQG